MYSLLPCLVVFMSLTAIQGFCGDSIRWTHDLNMDNVYGMWYGVGYAQHTPDFTNKPNEVGCVTLHITDVTSEPQEDWLNWSIQRHNYSDEEWRSPKRNPFSDNSMAGSWLDVRIKREIYTDRKLRVVWDEDGQSVEQTYLYTKSEPGLWVAEQRRPFEIEMQARGIDMWYPDAPPKHPEVIRVLEVSSELMIINHCSEKSGGIFSLILRRSPSKVNRWEWYDYKRKFYNYDLPNMYRYTTICAGCIQYSSLLFVLLSVAVFVAL